MEDDNRSNNNLFITFRILPQASFTLKIDNVIWLKENELPIFLVDEGQLRLVELELEVFGELTVELEGTKDAIKAVTLEINSQMRNAVVKQKRETTKYSWILHLTDSVKQTMGSDGSYVDQKKSGNAEELYVLSAEPQTFYSVDILFATNRKRNQEGFTEDAEDENKVNYGLCEVNIPVDKRIGEIPRPKWWKLEFRHNPQKHMRVLDMRILGYNDFYDQVRERIQLSEEKDALLFIHGYNVSFEDAILRTAQICVDLAFKGAPILYSWPSRGKVQWYLADGERVQKSYPCIAQVLKDLRKTGIENIHIIAHSMGNRALVNTLIALQREAFFKDFNFRQIILAAPDIDADEFICQLAPQIKHCSDRITLYASSRDKALLASKFIHDGHRAGDSERIISVDGIDTIDASNVNTNLLAHDYYSTTYELINDIYQLIKHGHPPNGRNLMPMEIRDLKYWKFRKA